MGFRGWASFLDLHQLRKYAFDNVAMGQRMANKNALLRNKTSRPRRGVTCLRPPSPFERINRDSRIANAIGGECRICCLDWHESAIYLANSSRWSRIDAQLSDSDQLYFGSLAAMRELSFQDRDEKKSADVHPSSSHGSGVPGGSSASKGLKPLPKFPPRKSARGS